MDKIEIIKTDRGGLKIVFNDYMYTKQKNLANNKIRWECVEKKRKNVKVV